MRGVVQGAPYGLDEGSGFVAGLSSIDEPAVRSRFALGAALRSETDASAALQLQFDRADPVVSIQMGSALVTNSLV
jgi:hypothetical protein